MKRPDFNCIKYDTQTEIEDIRLYLKDLNEYCNYLESENKQLRIGGVVERLPIGTEVTIIDNEDWGFMSGSKLKITGYCNYNNKTIGYLCDGEGIFLNEDFAR